MSSPQGEIEQLFDLYWGGKERRITGMTVRIMGVNVLAVIALLLGVVYLGQYHATLVQSKLERFETEVMLVSAALAEVEISENNQDQTLQTSEGIEKTRILSARLGATLNKRILVMKPDWTMVADSEKIIQKKQVQPIFKVIKEDKKELGSVEILKDTAGWIASLFPKYNELPEFPGVTDKTVKSYYYSDLLLNHKSMNMTAWRDDNGSIVITAAMPIISNGQVLGIVLLVSRDDDIREALADTWFNILKIFLVTCAITVLLSIYLSGVIARPLRKLAGAAESVRKGKLNYTAIPDMSHRHDEIGELSLVLRDMTYALWERMDSIESFAADVAHEIKNPLTSLKSAVETALIVKKKEDMDKLLEVIRHDVDRLDRLITDISNASRLDSELSREMFRKVDLKDVLRDLVDAYKNPLEREADHKDNSLEVLQDGVFIQLSLPAADHLYVQGSEIRLLQVFQNLLTNALSFAPKKSKITLSATVDENRVTVTVEDEGPGIPESKLKTIFERFYSERPEHEAYGRHSGLGLSICKQIITAMNGMIYAENRTDRNEEIKGARFVVILTLIDDE